MARLGGEDWEITAIAPSFFHGDLRDLEVEKYEGELCRLETVDAYFTREPHVWCYGWRLHDLLTQNWDLVHCWEEPYVVAGGQVCWWTPRATKFVFFTEQNIVKQYSPPFSWIERYCVIQCSGWIAPGKSVINVQLQRGYEVKPHREIPHGVDVKHFSPNSHKKDRTLQQLGWSLERKDPIIGFVGRFVEEKGPRFLMSVLDVLPGSWRALFVGSGPLESDLRRWAQRYGGRAQVLTDVHHDDVPSYLNAIDLLCVPSQTVSHWREQFGRIIIEAFACGVPVIASDSGEIPNLVGDSGIVVNEHDRDGWVNALVLLLKNQCRRRELGERGLKRAHRYYAWEVVAREHLEFFAEVLADGQNAASRGERR
jgi:glycosyltransferase involved in cell wall biosynthesis